MKNMFALPQTGPEMGTGLVKNRTRANLKNDILVGLGAPTIKVELTEDQIGQAIDSALRQFWTHHRDGSFENFYYIQVTAEQAAQGWIKIPENIDAIIEVLPRGFGGGDAGFTNIEWQMTAAALPGASGGSAMSGSSYSIGTPGVAAGMSGAFGGITKINQGALNSFSFSDFMIAKQSLATAREMMGSNNQYFNFARYQRRLYPRFQVAEGQFIAFRCYENVDPDLHPETCGELFDDETLKNLATANAKVIWGSVLRKFGGIQLPGGVTLEGDTLVEEGNAEVAKIIEDMQESQPVNFFIG